MSFSTYGEPEDYEQWAKDHPKDTQLRLGFDPTKWGDDVSKQIITREDVIEAWKPELMRWKAQDDQPKHDSKDSKQESSSKTVEKTVNEAKT